MATDLTVLAFFYALKREGGLKRHILPLAHSQLELNFLDPRRLITIDHKVNRAVIFA